MCLSEIVCIIAHIKFSLVREKTFTNKTRNKWIIFILNPNLFTDQCAKNNTLSLPGFNMLCFPPVGCENHIQLKSPEGKIHALC